MERFTSFVAIFEIEHIAADQVHFYEFNAKKSANLAMVRGNYFLCVSFHFKF